MVVRFLGGRVDGEAIILPPSREPDRAGEFLLGEINYGGKPFGPLCLVRENLTKTENPTAHCGP